MVDSTVLDTILQKQELTQALQEAGLSETEITKEWERLTTVFIFAYLEKVYAQLPIADKKQIGGNSEELDISSVQKLTDFYVGMGKILKDNPSIVDQTKTVTQAVEATVAVYTAAKNVEAEAEADTSDNVAGEKVTESEV